MTCKIKAEEKNWVDKFDIEVRNNYSSILCQVIVCFFTEHGISCVKFILKQNQYRFTAFLGRNFPSLPTARCRTWCSAQSLNNSTVLRWISMFPANPETRCIVDYLPGRQLLFCGINKVGKGLNKVRLCANVFSLLCCYLHHS